jgi:tetratricopeptide (TPR) repeat protein
MIFEGFAVGFDGFLMPDGEMVSIKDTNRVFSLLARRIENPERLKRRLWNLACECEVKGYQQAVYGYCEKMLLLADDAGEKANCFLMMGLAMEQMQNYEAAFIAYLKGVDLQQDSEDIWYFLNNNAAFCLNQLGRYREAEKYCRIAIKVEPRRHNAYKNLGIALQNLGQYAEAARNFIFATRLCPTDKRALELLIKLATAHPEIRDEIPDLEDQLLKCHEAVLGVEEEFRIQ